MPKNSKDYASNDSDEEWIYLEHLIPGVHAGGGRPAVHDRREIIDGIF